jgi:hypothetical protein
MKRLISHEKQNRIARKMMFDEPELIEKYFRKNLLLNESMSSCLEAMNWLDKVGDRKRGFDRIHSLQLLRPSNDGSMIHGVFKIKGKWYKSSFRTGRLFFKFWGTDIGCLANVPEEDIGVLLKELNAKSYTHLKAEFSSLFRNDYHNNAFFSWKKSIFYGCIRHKGTNMTENLIDSEFQIKKSKNDFFEFIKPYIAECQSPNLQGTQKCQARFDRMKI